MSFPSDENLESKTNYLGKVDPSQICEMIQLCSVREKHGDYLVAVKRLNGTIEELPLNQIALADEFEGSPIHRSYSSGHIFVNEYKNKVYLVGVEKNGRIQYQFTGGSPMEDQFRNIFFEDNGVLKIRLFNVEDNALIRTKNRTGVDVVDNFNDIPLVDWALIENQKEDGSKFWRLVLLMHYIVKSYEGELSFNLGTEDIVDGKWFDIESLNSLIENPVRDFTIAPNAYIVTKKSLELIY